MGYTHYWRIVDPVAMGKAMPKLVNDYKKIIKAVRYDLQCELEISKNGILLNGSGDDGHETFHFTCKEGFHWCKTDQEPHDLIVCATLLRAKDIATDAVKIESDGDWDEWGEAIATINSIWPGITVTCPW